MAPFALKRRLGRKVIQEMFTIDPRTPHQHYPWFWWECLATTGLEHFWPADEINAGTLHMRGFIRRLHYRLTPEEQTALLKRLYSTQLHLPRHSYPTAFRRVLWSKGGGWDSRKSYTKIIMLGETIERPECWWKDRLGPEGIRTIERELRGVAHPDRNLYPDAIHLAIEYVRSRAAQWGGRKMAYRWIAWFFQTAIPLPEEKGHSLKWVKPDGTKHWAYRYPIRW